MAKLTASQQIAALKSLKQQSAAWLLGCHVKTLRDNSQAPRAEDGSYNGAELLEWARSNSPRPELSDDDLERITQVGEHGLDEGPHGAAFELLDYLREQYGDSGLLAFMDVLIEDLGYSDTGSTIGSEPPGDTLPPEDQAALIAEAVEERKQQWARENLRYRVVCEECGCYRNGSTWHEGKPPKPCVVLKGTCPECDE